MRVTSALEEIEPEEAIADRLADCKRAVVPEDHRGLVAHVFDEPLALLKVSRDSFIFVIGDIVPRDHRSLRMGQQTFGHCTYRLPGGRMEMHHRMGVLARHMYRRMDGEARRVHRVGRRHDRIAFDVDLDERRGRDLFEHHIIGVDEEVMLRPRNTRRQVGENQVVPSVECDKTIRRGQIDTGRPFLVADGASDMIVIRGHCCGGHCRVSSSFVKGVSQVSVNVSPVTGVYRIALDGDI